MENKTPPMLFSEHRIRVIGGIIGITLISLAIVIFGWFRCLSWETNPGVRNAYENKKLEAWADKPTPWLTNLFKKRVFQQSSNILSIFYPLYPMDSVRWDADYSVLLNLLNKRKDEKVYACFLEAFLDPKNYQRKYDLILSLSAYDQAAKDIPEALLQHYMGSERNYEVKNAIVRLFLRTNIIRPEMGAKLKKDVEDLRENGREKSSNYLFLTGDDEIMYLKKLGARVIQLSNGTVSITLANEGEGKEK